ncbi:MAG TPA: DUF167 family protein [Gaiellaceae bacterium]|nr:DUF167 family protein [Gaiellaceae bacterium]
MDGPSIRMRLRVSPGARRSGIVGRHGAAWKVRVAASPEGGKANAAVLDLLAAALELPSGSVELVAGRSARDKVVVLHGVTAAEAETRLAAAAGGAS